MSYSNQARQSYQNQRDLVRYRNSAYILNRPALMFKFLKNTKATEEKAQLEPLLKIEQDPPKSWFKRLQQGLKRTSNQLGNALTNLVLSKKAIDAELLEELETQLLLADVGITTSEKILARLSERVNRKELTDPQALITALKQQLKEILLPCSIPINIHAKPFVILMVGVNGAGKTTSIAKLTHYYQQQGLKILLAAGDTFRAAAVEQLQVWGERNNVPVIAQHSGADSASVVFDAMEAATARHYDILIADTAGRLHTQSHLMNELAKIKRVMGKINPEAPHEIMLVLDASSGQNALHQAQQFHEAINLTSISLTKLDGTAKGGIIFAIADTMKLPIRFIGVGEKMDDLKPFDADEFVEALFAEVNKKENA